MANEHIKGIQCLGHQGNANQNHEIMPKTPPHPLGRQPSKTNQKKKKTNVREDVEKLEPYAL